MNPAHLSYPTRLRHPRAESDTRNGIPQHLGTYWGGDQIARSCEPNRYVHVNTWTHHPDVVLTAIIPHGMDWDSHIVTLTGRPDT